MALSEKELITRMIKDDLINYKLVMGLNKLGLVSELYFLNTSETIFKLMGIKSPNIMDSMYTKYDSLKKQVLKFKIDTSHKKLDQLSLKIYRELKYLKLYQSSFKE